MQHSDKIKDPEIAVTFEGLKVPVSPFVPEPRIRQIAAGKYERPETRLGLKLVNDSDRIVELGSGIGFVGGFIAVNKPGSQLRSFEANPNLIPHVEKLYALNGLSDRAHVENRVVLSDPDHPDHIQFHLHGSFLGSSLYNVGGADRPKPLVPTLGWGALKAEFAPTALIMDIEGGELQLLEHADLSGLRVVILELHPRHYGQAGVDACIAALRAQGLVQRYKRSDVRAFIAE